MNFVGSMLWCLSATAREFGEINRLRGAEIKCVKVKVRSPPNCDVGGPGLLRPLHVELEPSGERNWRSSLDSLANGSTRPGARLPVTESGLSGWLAERLSARDCYVALAALARWEDRHDKARIRPSPKKPLLRRLRNNREERARPNQSGAEPALIFSRYATTG